MDVTRDSLPGGLVTFLFTDIEASTRLQGRLGDAWPALVGRHDALLGGIVRDAGGAVVKTLGDGLFAAFPDAAAGVRAAAAIRTAVAAEPWGVDLRVRAGLHLGPAQPVDGDYVALAATTAARVSAAAHGGQVLVSDEVAAAVPDPPPGSRWQPLGAFTLPGLEAPVRLVALDDGTAFPAPRALPVARHNVAPLRTSFVGRAEELAEVTALLATDRLVSVLGPGGTGKTRLASELAKRVSADFADGAWVVLLADLPPGGDVADRVATTLGVAAVPGRPVEQALADWCAKHAALVVLDNCEHVTPAAAALADALLTDDSRVRLLVTSREPLHVAGEVCWRLRPLPAEWDAPRLFADRARLAAPGLDIAAETPGVVELCRQLDGLPLAIELAAARLRTTSLDGLLRSVSDRVRLLRGSTYGVAERHLSLQALLDWSHDLLPDDERLVLRRCASFQAAFSEEAAAVVCDLPPDDAADLVARLADRSLLVVTPGDRRPYRMLLTIRDYARARLDESGDAAATRDRHAAWAAEEIGGGRVRHVDAGATLALVGGRYDDALAALDHVAATGDGPLLVTLANALFHYWLVTGAFVTALHWLRRAAALGDARATARAGTLVGALEPGSPEARELLDRGVALARESGDEGALADCLVRLGTYLARATKGEAGEAELREALTLRADSPRDRGGAFLGLGMIADNRGDYEAAKASYEAVVATGPGPDQTAIAEGNIASILLHWGNSAAATERLTTALALVEGREPSATVWICTLLHRIALADDDPALAAHWLDRALRTAEAVGATEHPDVARVRDLKAALPG